MNKASKKPNHTTGQLHSRNRHLSGYDFSRLVQSCPELNGFLQRHPLAGVTIDFANPAAVIALNRALLKSHYGVVYWDIPSGYLCPPIPSRADYLHYAADLLAENTETDIPRGSALKILDIGVGANCIYPLIGAHEYGWNFVGTELDPTALAWARGLVLANAGVAKKIELRQQSKADAIFKNVIHEGEQFALSMCNPPFHTSIHEAAAATQRKLKNLGGETSSANPLLNFGGRSHELWSQGGEVLFVRRMIAESVTWPELCGWFTTLVSKRASLPEIERELGKARAREVRIISMFAGQKQSRIVAWTFLSAERRRARLDARDHSY